MADYIYNNGELYHANKKKKVKYIAKVPISNGKYRYFYTQEEYDTYKNSKKPKESKLKSKLKSVSKFFKKISNKISKLFKKSKKELGETLEKGRKFVDEVIFGKKKNGDSLFDVKEKIHKYIARVKMSNGKYKYFYDAETYERYLKRMEYQKNEPEFMKKVPKIPESDGYTADEDMAEVNKDYSRYDKATSQNCTNCTAAYELRCRGYDVSASDYKNYIVNYDNASMFRFPLYYKDAKTIRLDDEGKEHKSPLNNTVAYKRYEYDSRTVTEAILKHSGKNTRGDISVMWKEALAGHSMAYEVDSKGKVTIRDCQTNRTYKVEDIVDQVNAISITRTDNLELRKGILDAVE
jgi:hypothetical protein